MTEQKKKLRFTFQLKGKPSNGSATSMKLTNPTNNHIYFQIRTKPAQLCFTEPNKGVVKPGEEIKIHVFVKEIPSTVDIVVDTIPSDANFVDEMWTDKSKIVPYPFSWIFTVGPTATNPNEIKCVTEPLYSVEVQQELNLLKTKQLSLEEENMNLKKELLLYQGIIGKIQRLAVTLPFFTPMENNESKPEADVSSVTTEEVATSVSKGLVKENINEKQKSDEVNFPRIRLVDFKTLQSKKSLDERDALMNQLLGE